MSRAKQVFGAAQLHDTAFSIKPRVDLLLLDGKGSPGVEREYRGNNSRGHAQETSKSRTRRLGANRRTDCVGNLCRGEKRKEQYGRRDGGSVENVARKSQKPSRSKKCELYGIGVH